MTATTMTMASASVSSTSWIEPLMKVASSEVTMTRVPGGSEALSTVTAARTPSEIASVDDPAWRMTPMADAGLAVDARLGGRLVRSEAHEATSRRRVWAFQENGAEGLRRREPGVGAHHEFLSRRFQLPRGLVERRLASAFDTSPSVRPRVASSSGRTSI